MKISLLIKTDILEAIFSEKYYDRLRRMGELAIYDRDNFEDRAYVLDFVRSSDIIVTSWHSPAIDAEILEACPTLSGVFHAAGSVKPILSPELIAREDIRLTACAAAIGEGVAETALSFAIAACKGAFTLQDHVKNGGWDTPDMPRVLDFYDIMVGIIGGGFVGRHMIKLLKNYHVDVLLYDPTLTREQVAELGAAKCELEDLLLRADVISVHAPSIPATEKMLNATNLPLIKDGAILVNTARGAIFDEPALIEELKKGRFFACLDVTEPEPPAADNPLRDMPNVLLTPHIAGTARNGKRRIALHICEETERFLSGERMRTEIDRAALARMA